MSMPAALYPPFGLRVTAGPLTMRILQDDDLPAYADLVRGPIFPASAIDADADHVFPWYKAEPEQRAAQGIRFQWELRSALQPEAWTLSLGVFIDGALRGMQDIRAEHFAQRRTITSGSWLSADQHGRGHGTLMRQAMLALAFDHLGARRAESAAEVGNAASLAVSRRCGYTLNGTGCEMHGDRPVMVQQVLVTPETFIRPAVPVEVSGLGEELRGMLGAQ